MSNREYYIFERDDYRKRKSGAFFFWVMILSVFACMGIFFFGLLKKRISNGIHDFSPTDSNSSISKRADSSFQLFQDKPVTIAKGTRGNKPYIKQNTQPIHSPKISTDMYYLHGRVITYAGNNINGLAGVRVTCTSCKEPFQTLTNDNGEYTIKLISNERLGEECRLSFSFTKEKFQSKTITVNCGQGDIPNVELLN